MKKLLLAFVFTLTAAILAGCGSVHIDLDKDGSAKVTYQIPLENELYTLKDIEKEVKSSVESANEGAGEEVVKIKRIKEKDGVVTVDLQVKDIVSTSSNISQAPVKDMSRLYLDDILSLQDKDGEKIGSDKVENLGNYIVFVMDTDSSLTETKVTLPGKVLYVSDGVEIEDNKTVVTDESEITVIYKESGANFLLPLLILVVIIAIGFGVMTFMRKNKLYKINKTDSAKLVGENNNA